jgi:ATP-dependent DNA helicase 2 subunit 1
MDLDPEGIFRDDSDEDEDNVQVRTASFPPFIIGASVF